MQPLCTSHRQTAAGPDTNHTPLLSLKSQPDSRQNTWINRPTDAQQCPPYSRDAAVCRCTTKCTPTYACTHKTVMATSNRRLHAAMLAAASSTAANRTAGTGAPAAVMHSALAAAATPPLLLLLSLSGACLPCACPALHLRCCQMPSGAAVAAAVAAPASAAAGWQCHAVTPGIHRKKRA